ncbi:MAG: FecR family protein [Verrucomicrobiota bacterium]|nr:FecR family protein [Verrucomicrobiota bacterium]
MKTPLVKVVACVAFLGPIQSVVLMAAPFNPEFKIERIVGECRVKTSGAGDFVAAEADKSYPYGTEIKTGAKSSVVIVLSEGNECQVLANAQLTVTEDATDKKLKRIKLVEGRVDASLEKDFRNSNGFEIETPAAVCGVIGSKVSAAVRSQSDKNIGAFGCNEGRMNVRGNPYFSAPDMDAGDQITVACALDRSYIYLRNSAGEYEVELKGADGAPRRVKTKPNVVIKIHIRKAVEEEKEIVTTVIEGLEEQPEGTSWVYVTLPGEGGKPVEKPMPPPAEEGEELRPSVMPTTTTTAPSPTPVGER